MTDRDTLIKKLESAANLMRGIHLDPRIPQDTKNALLVEATQIDELTERLGEGGYEHQQTSDGGGDE